MLLTNFGVTRLNYSTLVNFLSVPCELSSRLYPNVCKTQDSKLAQIELGFQLPFNYASTGSVLFSTPATDVLWVCFTDTKRGLRELSQL